MKKEIIKSVPEKKETIGKASLDLKSKTPDSMERDPIAIQQEVHKDYDLHIEDCIKRGSAIYDTDFFIVVIIKKERILHNVIRNYFFCRSTCPTPDYDQIVYKYHRKDSKVEFLWVIPSRDTCILFKNNALLVDPRERDLLKFVLDFADGTLYLKMKELNNEKKALGYELEDTRSIHG